MRINITSSRLGPHCASDVRHQVRTQQHFKNNFIYSFLALLLRLFSSCSEWGLLSNCGAQASHRSGFSCEAPAPGRLGFNGCGTWAQSLQVSGIVIVQHGLSYSVACGVFSDQGLNRCLLNWQMDYLPLNHQGSPQGIIFSVFLSRVYGSSPIMGSIGHTEVDDSPILC